MQRIGFGGGCHWCTEAVFQTLRGVTNVRQGFIAADPPQDSWSEAAEIDFDPAIITLDDLIAVHLATHASTANHKMRTKYRSAVYTSDAAQTAHARAALQAAAQDAGVAFVTQVLAHRGFRPSDPKFHNYFQSGPERPFCQTYIDPKLAKLRARFPALLKT